MCNGSSGSGGGSGGSGSLSSKISNAKEMSKESYMSLRSKARGEGRVKGAVPASSINEKNGIANIQGKTSETYVPSSQVKIEGTRNGKVVYTVPKEYKSNSGGFGQGKIPSEQKKYYS